MTGTYNRCKKVSSSIRRKAELFEEIEFRYLDEEQDVVLMVLAYKDYVYDEDTLAYGDARHEEYLCSDDYDSDSRSEQWDWLRNE